MENPFCFAYTVTDFVNAPTSGVRVQFEWKIDRPDSVIIDVSEETKFIDLQRKNLFV